MNEFLFTEAKREKVGLLIAFAGASGSGKTFSALTLAQGLSPGGKIAFIDTEARRGLHYATDFSFRHCDMRSPFTPGRFIEAIQAAERDGAEVVILDSFSHEYDGEGGIIQWADELAAKGVKSPGNWKEPKMAHKKMMNALLQCRAHLIFCLRADEKIEIVREGGKTQVRPLGWMPICEKRFMYEMTASFTLTPDRPGMIDYSLPHKLQQQHRAMFADRTLVTGDAGRAIAAWSQGDEPPSTQPDKPADTETAEQAARSPSDLFMQGEARAKEGSVALWEWGKSLTKEERVVVGRDQIERWKQAAKKAAA